MTNNRNAQRRSQAQAAVHEHVNLPGRSGGKKHDWNFIHVIHLKTLGLDNWMAVVLVQDRNQQIFTVTRSPEDRCLKVDTFTRQHVSRFY